MSAEVQLPSGPTREPATIADAMSHVVDVGERLVSHRLELALVELRQAIEHAQRTAQVMLGAALFAGCGWVFAMLALFSWLESFSSRPIAAAAVGGLQLALAAGLVLGRDKLLGTSE
jgi:hypothetical protein